MRRLKKPLGIDTLQLLKILRDSDDGVENLMSYANNSNNNNGGGDNGC
jgi:hypothetical protein